MTQVTRDYFAELHALHDACAEKYNSGLGIVTIEEWLGLPAVRLNDSDMDWGYTYLDLILDGGIEEVMIIARNAFG